jgi:hypothetical protein
MTHCALAASTLLRGDVQVPDRRRAIPGRVEGQYRLEGELDEFPLGARRSLFEQTRERLRDGHESQNGGIVDRELLRAHGSNQFR